MSSSEAATHSDCVFCAIIGDDAPASMVYESERVVAFMDIDPITPGHTLIVPRAHIPAIGDVSHIALAEMMIVAQQLGDALRASPLQTDGVNLWSADGEAAGQDVFHTHLHVFPRFAGDGFAIDASRGTAPDRETLDTQADQLRAALAGA